MTKAPFAGLRVLHLSRVVAAPTAAQMLGDFGAEVIKVERPGRGDEIRHYGPVYVQGADGAKGDSAFHTAVNRNKRSLTLDLAHPRGQEIAKRLAAKSDVLIENYKAGTLQRYGLDYASLQPLNPRLIYCSLTGYGQDGPYAARPGFDAVFQAQGGLMSVTGMPDGAPGAGPTKVGLNIMDSITGYNATIAILTALYERMASGEGQFIDVALLDCAIATNAVTAAQHLIDPSYVPFRRHVWSGAGGPQEILDCADGQVLIIGGNDAMFAALCEVMGLAELAKDARFLTPHLRSTNSAVLFDLLAAQAKAWRRADLLQALADADVPAGAINDMRAVFEDPQVKHRGMAVKMQHPLGREIDILANPLKLSRTPPEYRLPPPLLGQHSDEILRDLAGLNDAEIAALRADRVV
jgi:crotonobetainyl-CoA:carnitine CoA-transferase CaiB-like acyl-CoA transferase